MNLDVFAEEVGNKSTTNNPGSLNPKTSGYSSQMLLAATWTPGTEAKDKLHNKHCLEASAKFQLILCLSQQQDEAFTCSKQEKY